MPQQTVTEEFDTPIFDALAAEFGFEWDEETEADG
jgi:hypothetical protein